MKIITALITPFNNKNKIDYFKLGKLIEKQIDQDASGIVVGGSTGERHLLTDYEENRLYQFVTCNYGDKIDIYLGIGEPSTALAIKKLKKYNKLNFKGYLVNVPFYILPPQEKIVEYFKKIAGNTQKEIIVYDIEKRNGVLLELQTIKEIVKIPNVLAIKESTKSFKRLKELYEEKLPILIGDDKWYLWGLTTNIEGIISVMSNQELLLMKDPYLNINKYQKILKEISKYVNPIGIKLYMNKQGENVGKCREPL